MTADVTHGPPRSRGPKLLLTATIALALTIGMLTIVGDTANAAGQAAAPAAASGFAVLANAAATCTDGTITGDVGTFLAPPTGSVTRTRCPVTGTVHVGDAAARAAFNDFLSMYAALAPKTGDCDAAHTLPSTITGPVTLLPGVYCTGAALTGTGVLTLNAGGNSNAVWTFKIGTGGTGALTGTNFSVVMAGGGQPCNVFWAPSAGVTMTTSALQGNILAGAAITMTGPTTGGTFRGNAWSKADVTITNIAVTACATVGGTGCSQGNHKGKQDEHDRDTHQGKQHGQVLDAQQGQNREQDRDTEHGLDNGHELCDLGDSDQDDQGHKGGNGK